jgi:competence protein ComEC
MFSFSSVPFFRVLIPFAAGILAAVFFHLSLSVWFAIVCGLPLVVCLLIPALREHKRILLMITDLFLFVYAVSLTAYIGETKAPSHYRHFVHSDTALTFLVAVKDVPVKKEKSMKCEVKMLEVLTDQGRIKTTGNILVYFKKSAAAASLQAGNTVLLKGKLNPVAKPSNPFEFDYRQYLLNKQIFHTVFIDSSNFLILQCPPVLNPLWQLGLDCKTFILKRLQQSTLSGAAYGICAALLTGYDDDIDQTVMEAFAHSGTLHVLSVSGLHTGLIYLALNFIFGQIDRKNKYKITRFAVITLLLWLFGLITGFAAPVLRAVIMFNLLGLGKLFFRSTARNQLNILFASAFIMLNYSPWLITDVGFLLSYFAMFGLIYFSPRIGSIWNPENMFLKSFWTSVSASVAATLTTLPFTLFLFKQFPLWFFVCNIIVVPATFAILLIAILVVLKLNVAALVINWIVAALLIFINFFNKKELGFIDAIHFSFSDALFLAALILLFAMAVEFRSFRQMSTALGILVLWQCINLLQTSALKNEELLTVYQLKKETVCMVKNKQEVWLSNASAKALKFSVIPHLVSLNYAEISQRPFNLVSYGENCFMVLDSAGWRPAADLSKVNILLLAKNARLDAEDLKGMKNLKTIVLDGSNNAFSRRHAAELCRNFGIQFYDTRSNGAFILRL